MLAFGIGYQLGLPARPMEVPIRMEVLSVEALEALGLRRRDMRIAHVLANHRPVVRLHQAVVVAVPRPRFGLLDPQLVP